MSHVTEFKLPPMTPEELAHWNKALEWLTAIDAARESGNGGAR